MSRHSFGKPKPVQPTSSSGTWDKEPVVLSMQTRLKIVVRPPAGSGGPGDDTEADRFETALRQAVANVLLGTESDGFTVVGAVVEQFEDAGG